MAAMISDRTALTALVGAWTGTYLLWLEPDVLRTEGPTTCTGHAVLDDRFLRLDYTWTDVDDPQGGSMLLGCTDEGMWQLAWVDSWHMGTAMMFCESGRGADVVGSYGPPEERWGWRTRFDMLSHEELVITAWNIAPDGAEAKATEAIYRRAGA